MSKTTNPAQVWRHFDRRYRQEQTAVLITWSSVYAAPSGFEAQAPYLVAIVELEDKSRVCVQLTDLDEADLTFGMKLKPVLRKMFDAGERGVIPYGTKYTRA